VKFETINNTLCRMVEPEPLTDKAQFPCVVRLIQDDSPMGRYNQSYSEYRYGVRLGCCMLPIIATHIAKNGVVNDIEWDVNRYEIIGYPVVDGSAEWALWQMMQGKWVVHEKAYPCHIHCNVVTWSNDETPPLFTVQLPSRWLSDNLLYSGWQLYEPQPEPQPAYAVGDDVEVNVNGEMKQGKLVRFCSADFMQDNTDAFVLHDFFGRWYGYHRVADITRKLDPSEVRVKIGCLEGTVERHDGNPQHWFKLRSSEYNYALISIDMLDTPTRELVESLLRAQEEK